MSSLNSLNASLEEAATTRQQEVDKMEELMTKFKEEREQLISQVGGVGAICGRGSKKKLTPQDNRYTTLLLV